MRVRKVDSDAIKLYESSQVKFKTTGTIREVQLSAGVNKSCAIQNISKDTYLDKATGEIKERKYVTRSCRYWQMGYHFMCLHSPILTW